MVIAVEKQTFHRSRGDLCGLVLSAQQSSSVPPCAVSSGRLTFILRVTTRQRLTEAEEKLVQEETARRVEEEVSRRVRGALESNGFLAALQTRIDKEKQQLTDKMIAQVAQEVEEEKQRRLQAALTDLSPPLPPGAPPSSTDFSSSDASKSLVPAKIIPPPPPPAEPAPPPEPEVDPEQLQREQEEQQRLQRLAELEEQARREEEDRKRVREEEDSKKRQQQLILGKGKAGEGKPGQDSRLALAPNPNDERRGRQGEGGIRCFWLNGMWVVVATSNVEEQARREEEDRKRVREEEDSKKRQQQLILGKGKAGEGKPGQDSLLALAPNPNDQRRGRQGEGGFSLRSVEWFVGGSGHMLQHGRQRWQSQTSSVWRFVCSEEMRLAPTPQLTRPETVSHRASQADSGRLTPRRGVVLLCAEEVDLEREHKVGVAQASDTWSVEREPQTLLSTFRCFDARRCRAMAFIQA
eukprot:CAMPEP_0202853786 /NCGR_PEP_ID=MMETSP1389-20130828/90660_1 /ASSEMBLY_ACC=CAM_ASM_000865 /TAXON_ID=302021 /ORGANISM="Rhodomonas sp., Strain CCMP768" /LENGTH=465 /DNA_ID=CAMNT_0049532345 /DNA_START=432 /DNA_END=1832 /DNA_ORIENTATION=-